MGTSYGFRPQGNTPIKNCVIKDFNQNLVTPFVTKDKFIITVDTSIMDGGTESFPSSSNNQFILPGFGESYSIEWFKKNDVQVRGEVEGNDETLITFPEPGVYIVIVSGGNFNRIRFSNGEQNISASNYKDHNKTLEINQWGSIEWSSLLSMFRDNSNLTMPAIDVPNLSGTSVLAGAFRGCSSFGPLSEPSSIGDWDVSTITYMSGSAGLGLFGECVVFNKNINSWDVSNVRNMSDLFRGATVFNQPLDNWNVSNVTSFFRAFNGARAFNQPIGNWTLNTSNGVNMFAMFRDASAFNQDLSGWNTSQVTTLGGSVGSGFFNGAFENSSFNQDVSGWDTSNLVSAGMVFSNSSFNQDIGQWNTSKLRAITRLSNAFNYSLENWDLSSMEDMRELFDYTSISTENLSKTLVGWANFVYSNNGPYNISLGANNKNINSVNYFSGSQFTNAVDAKNYLVETVENGGAGWTITGAVLL